MNRRFAPLSQTFLHGNDLPAGAAALHRIAVHAQDGYEGLKGFFRADLDGGVDGDLPLDGRVSDEVLACGFADILDEGMDIDVFEIHRDAALGGGNGGCAAKAETCQQKQAAQRPGDFLLECGHVLTRLSCIP
nr:hypothetical protein [uncultured Desulfovibrio sp.]